MIQDYHEVSTIQRYPVGQRYALDERVFRYARAGGVILPDFAVKSFIYQQVVFSVVAAAAVGAKTLTVTVGATDGMAGNGAIAANELAGGNCVLFSSVAHATMNRRIVSNTAVAAGGGAMTITIDRPLNLALTAVARIECIGSLYANVQITPADSPYMPVVGVPMVPAVLGQFLWLQTWGPLWTNADLAVSVGANNRLVKFGPDGNLHPVVAGDAFNSTQGQIAGHAMCNILAGVAQGAPFVFLTIAP